MHDRASESQELVLGFGLIKPSALCFGFDVRVLTTDLAHEEVTAVTRGLACALCSTFWMLIGHSAL